MKIIRTLAIVTVLALAAATANGAEEKSDDEDLREEMKQARAELAEAARRVAELGRELGAETGENFAFRFFTPGSPRRAMLGVSIGDDGNGKDGREPDGVEVLSVTPGGPADKAGIQAGDVITAIGETDLAEAESPSRALLDAMGEIEPGDEIEVAYRRGNDKRSAQVTADAFEAPIAFFADGHGNGLPHLPRAPFLELMHGWGNIELAPVSPGLGEYFGTDGGVLVVHAPQDGDFKLKDGDVILAIDERKPEDPAHAMRILRSYRGGEKLVIDIMRKRENMSLEIVVPERRSGMVPRIDRRFAAERIGPG